MFGLSTELITKGNLATKTVNDCSFPKFILREKKKANKSELWT